MEDESKIPIGNRKHIFWQTSINDQRSKLRVLINNIAIEGILNIGVDGTIIIPASWHLSWPLKETDVQFLEIRCLFQVKQSSR